MRKDCENKTKKENLCVKNIKRSSLGDEKWFLRIKSLSLYARFSIILFKNNFCKVSKIFLACAAWKLFFLMFHHRGLRHKFSPYSSNTFLLCLIIIMMKIFFFLSLALSTRLKYENKNEEKDFHLRKVIQSCTHTHTRCFLFTLCALAEH